MALPWRKCAHTYRQPREREASAALAGGPERTLVVVGELSEGADLGGLQRHPRAVGSGDGGPVRRTVGTRCSGGDESAPVADHLLGQFLLRRIERRGARDVEQVAQ